MRDQKLTFGWFLPTSGDSTCLSEPSARLPQSRALFDEIVDVVDQAGFSYMLMPVNAACWEATVTGAFYLARTRNIAPLIALRSAYCNPVLSAKMFATLDQLSGGRLCINLIAGINDDDTRADGIPDTKVERYEKMDEEDEGKEEDDIDDEHGDDMTSSMPTASAMPVTGTARIRIVTEPMTTMKRKPGEDDTEPEQANDDSQEYDEAENKDEEEEQDEEGEDENDHSNCRHP